MTRSRSSNLSFVRCRPGSRAARLALLGCFLVPLPTLAATYPPEALACYQAAARGDTDFPTVCKQAVDLGDTHAMYLLGISSKDPDKALEWLERSAGGNHLRAMAELAERYRQQGDTERADELDRQAARAGYGPSRIRIAMTLRADTTNPDNVALARRTFIGEAIAGYPEAQHLAAIMLANGEGGPVDGAQARQWLFEAASAGYLPAQVDYALILVDSEPDEAVKWLRKAARAGSVQATYALAALSANGEVAPDDHRSALYWAHLAVRAGHPRAPDLLERIVAGPPPAPVLPKIESLADVQQALAALGFEPGPADGMMGSRTRSAIEQFRRAAGLPVGGDVDDALRDRLARALSASR